MNRDDRKFGTVKRDPKLMELMERAKNHKMTPTEIDAQRRSWVRGETMLDHPEMTEEEADALLRKVMGPPLAEQIAQARREALEGSSAGGR